MGQRLPEIRSLSTGYDILFGLLHVSSMVKWKLASTALVLTNIATNDAHARSGISMLLFLQKDSHKCIKAWNGKNICKYIILQGCAHNITAERYL
jgi:hypothetical protein